jgi:hypothetical protein
MLLCLVLEKLDADDVMCTSIAVGTAPRNHTLLVVLVFVHRLRVFRAHALALR